MDLINNYNIKLLDTPINGFTGDTNSRKIEACLVNLLGVRAIDKDVYLILTANLPDGGFVEWTQTPDEEGKYLITLDNAIYTVAGITSLTLTAKKNNQIKTAMVLHIKVDNSKLVSLSTSKPIEKPLKDADTVDGRHASDFVLKGTGIKQSDLSPELLQQMAGNTPINAVPADESVTPEKTTFIKSAKNLFDITKASDGFYWTGSSGTIPTRANSSPYSSSNFINLNKTGRITKNKKGSLLFLDSSQKIIYSSENPSSVNTPAGTFTIPAGTAYIASSVLTADKYTYQIEYGDIQTSYEKPTSGYTLDPIIKVSNIDVKEIEGTKILEETTPLNRLKLVKSPNLIDKEIYTPGYIVRYNGTITEDTINKSSQYLYVKDISSLIINRIMIGALNGHFYDANKESIVNSGIQIPAPATNALISPPTGAVWMRISAHNLDYETLDIQYGNTIKGDGRYYIYPEGMVYPVGAGTVSKSDSLTVTSNSAKVNFSNGLEITLTKETVPYTDGLFDPAKPVYQNKDVWRVTTCKINGIDITNNGAWETAIALTGFDDFHGTFHGYDRIKTADFFVNGVKVTAGAYSGDKFEVLLTGNLFKHGTKDEIIADYVREYIFENGILKLRQKYIWKQSLPVKNAYITMLPILQTTVHTAYDDSNFTIQNLNDSTTPIHTAHRGVTESLVWGDSYSARVKVVAPTQFNILSSSGYYHKLYFQYDKASITKDEVWDINSEFEIKAK